MRRLMEAIRRQARPANGRRSVVITAGVALAVCGAAVAAGSFSTASSEPTDAQTTAGPVQAIAAGDQHALAAGNSPYYGSGLVWAWGANWNGQVGDGTRRNNRFPPERVVAATGDGYLTGALAVEGGENHSVAVKSDGTVWAWGNNDHQQLGINAPPFAEGDYVRPQQVHGLNDDGFLTGAVTVAAGTHHNLVLNSDGTVYSWGEGRYGQLGVNSNNDHFYPVQVHGPGNNGYLTSITDVAAGKWHSLALKSDGTVWAWGDNSAFQLGNGSQTDRYTPVQVSGLSGVKAIAAGSVHNLALKQDGTVWSWGDNAYGQLGVNSDNSHSTPVQVHAVGNVGYLDLGDLTGVQDIATVAAGERHSLALSNDGTAVWSWGGNNHGQLGVHSDNRHETPVQVHGLGNVGYLSGLVDVAAGQFFSMALKNDGTAVYAWGGNSYGQIDASLNDRTYPVQVGGLVAGSPVEGPQVTKVVPADQATDVPRGRPVVATFSDKMEEASVEAAGTFTLTQEGSTTPVAATVSYNSVTDNATLIPRTPLVAGATYTATVSMAATNQDGLPLSEAMTWSFTIRG